MEDFLQYDFIGAPIHVEPTGTIGHGEGYNGGYSLRNRAKMLEITQKFSWKDEIAAGNISLAECETKEPCLKFEDQWFYHKLKEMKASLPSQEVASRFAVETIWSENPLGYHHIDLWQPDKLDQVAAWCPEYKLATQLTLRQNELPTG